MTLDTSGILARAAAREERRHSLPCFPHASDDEAGAAACEDAGAHKTCEFERVAPCCPRRRLLDDYDQVSNRLSLGRVEARERQLLLDAAARRVRLKPTQALRTVRYLLEPDGNVLAVLGGPRGVGKTLAACYAIARRGGLYLTAYPFARPKGIDIDEAKGAHVLVIDQLGRENIGASDYVLSQLEEVIDARYAGRRLTILVGNITREQFSARYDGIIEDRLAGDGVFVALEGTSLRRET